MGGLSSRGGSKTSWPAGDGGSSTLAGDAEGPSDANVVVAIQGSPVTDGSPGLGEVLTWDDSEWVPVGPAALSDATTSSTSTGVPNGDVAFRTLFVRCAPAGGVTAQAFILNANPIAGTEVIVKDVAGTADTIPITVTATATPLGAAVNIDGQASFVINQPYGWLRMRFAGASLGWSVVSDSSRKTVIVAASSTTTLPRRAKQFVNANSTGGAFQINFPATPLSGDEVSVYDSEGNAAVANITLAGNGKVFNSASPIVMNVAYSLYSFTFNGTRWAIT